MGSRRGWKRGCEVWAGGGGMVEVVGGGISTLISFFEKVPIRYLGAVCYAGTVQYVVAMAKKEKEIFQDGNFAFIS